MEALRDDQPSGNIPMKLKSYPKSTTSSIEVRPKVEKCQEPDCKRPGFRTHQKLLCKHHFSNKVKRLTRMQFQIMYKGPEIAYGELDFEGRGFIFESDILESAVMR